MNYFNLNCLNYMIFVNLEYRMYQYFKAASIESKLAHGIYKTVRERMKFAHPFTQYFTFAFMVFGLRTCVVF